MNGGVLEEGEEGQESRGSGALVSIGYRIKRSGLRHLGERAAMTFDEIEAPMSAPNTRTISMRAQEVQVVSNPRFDAFWSYVNIDQWEPTTFAILETFIQSDSVAIDIGAWIGPTTLFAAQLGERILAVEPDPGAFAMLEANVAANPGLASRVTLSSACIAPADGPLRMGSRSSQAGGDGASSLLYADSDVGWNVEGIHLDTACARHGVDRIDVLKIDVEGAESLLIPSIRDRLCADMPTLILSMHPHFMRRPLTDTLAIAGILARYPYLYTAELELASPTYVCEPANLNRAYEIIATRRSPESLSDTVWAEQAARLQEPKRAHLQADARALYGLAEEVFEETARRIESGSSSFSSDRLATIRTAIQKAVRTPDSSNLLELQRFIRTFRRFYSLHMS